MLLCCSLGAALSVTGSNTTSRRQRTPRLRRAHSSTPISPVHLPARRRQSDPVGRPSGSGPYCRPYAVIEEGKQASESIHSYVRLLNSRLRKMLLRVKNRHLGRSEAKSRDPEASEISGFPLSRE